VPTDFFEYGANSPRAFPRFPLLKGKPNAFDTADNGLLSRALHLLSGFSALQGGAVDCIAAC